MRECPGRLITFDARLLIHRCDVLLPLHAYILRSIEYEGFDNGLGELSANETVVIGEENAQSGMEKRRQIVLSHFTTATH